MTTNIYDMADTWNNGATTFTAIKMNVTDSASDANSLLIDLQVGSVTKFNIVKDGKLRLGSISYSASTPALSMTGQTGTGISWSGNGLFFSTNGNSRFAVNDAGLGLTSDRVFGWASGAADAGPVDTAFSRVGAADIAAGNGSSGNATANLRVGSLRVNQTPTANSSATTTITNGADSSTNLGHRASFDMNGTTYWFPCGSTAF